MCKALKKCAWENLKKRAYMGTYSWFILLYIRNTIFPVAQPVKRLPTMQETWVQSPGREDLLEKEMATHSSILAWRIPWLEEPGRLQFMGLQRVGYN